MKRLEMPLWMKLAARCVMPSPLSDIKAHDPRMIFIADEGGGRWLRLSMPLDKSPCEMKR